MYSVCGIQISSASSGEPLRQVASELKQRDACPEQVLAVFTKFPREGDNLPAIAEWATTVSSRSAAAGMARFHLL